MSFGLEESNGKYAFHGLLDDVRLWNVARSPEEIAANYNRLIDPSTSGLVGYWNFDEASGQDIFDATSNNNDGILGATVAVGTDDPTRVLSTAPIPEPATLSLLTVGALGLIRRRKK